MPEDVFDNDGGHRGSHDEMDYVAEVIWRAELREGRRHDKARVPLSEKDVGDIMRTNEEEHEALWDCLQSLAAESEAAELLINLELKSIEAALGAAFLAFVMLGVFEVMKALL